MICLDGINQNHEQEDLNKYCSENRKRTGKHTRALGVDIGASGTMTPLYSSRIVHSLFLIINYTPDAHLTHRTL